jgi:hypothetical protein
VSIPDLSAWRRGYPRKAAETGGAVPACDDAIRLVQAFADPVLVGTAAGTWDSERSLWTTPGESRSSCPAGS